MGDSRDRRIRAWGFANGVRGLIGGISGSGIQDADHAGCGIGDDPGLGLGLGLGIRDPGLAIRDNQG
jgi:hypothetical protein